MSIPLSEAQPNKGAANSIFSMIAAIKTTHLLLRIWSTLGALKMPMAISTLKNFNFSIFGKKVESRKTWEFILFVIALFSFRGGYRVVKAKATVSLRLIERSFSDGHLRPFWHDFWRFSAVTLTTLSNYQTTWICSTLGQCLVFDLRLYCNY